MLLGGNGRRPRRIQRACGRCPAVSVGGRPCAGLARGVCSAAREARSPDDKPPRRLPLRWAVSGLAAGAAGVACLLPVALSQLSSRPQPLQEYSTLCSRNNLAARGTLISVARSASRAVHGGPSRPTPIRTVQAGDVPSHRSSSSGAQAVNPVTADVPSRSLWQSERHSGDSRHGGSGEHRRRHGVASPVGRVTVEWWRDDSIAIGAFMRRN